MVIPEGEPMPAAAVATICRPWTMPPRPTASARPPASASGERESPRALTTSDAATAVAGIKTCAASPASIRRRRWRCACRRRSAARDCHAAQPQAPTDPTRADHGRARISRSRCTSRCAICRRSCCCPGSSTCRRTRSGARDQREIRRVVHGRAEHRDGPRAAVARLSDRSARHILPAVLGRRPEPDIEADPRLGREAAGRKSHEPGREESLVLLIRSELLRRYPNAVIYAAEAKKNRTDVRKPASRATKREVPDLSRHAAAGRHVLRFRSHRPQAKGICRCQRPAGSSSSRSSRPSRASASTSR